MARTTTSLLEKILLGLVLLLANLRATVFVFLSPDPTRPFGAAWNEILLWIIAFAGVLYLLVREEQAEEYLALWRRNWPLAVFLLLAVVSITWSVGPLASTFRVLELVFSTLIAAYYGLRLGPEKMMQALFWFGALLYIISIGLALGTPPTGTMPWLPYDGAWRGVYWHRNHLGSIAAFLSIVYLCRLLLAVRNRHAKGILDGFFYALSLALIYFTRSATAYIVFLVLNFSVLVILLWLWLSPRLQRRHYLWILAGGVVAALLLLTNLNLFFGLFHRDTSLTGRTGLWLQLLAIASQRFWLGHGFGAVWVLDSFREQVRLLVGWFSQPLIADNGFLDIYLHLGLVGLVLFLGVLLLAAVRAIRYALAGRTLASFFPVLVLVYALFANISFSLFAETEVFVWFLIVAVLFMTMAGRTSGVLEPEAS